MNHRVYPEIYYRLYNWHSLKDFNIGIKMALRAYKKTNFTEKQLQDIIKSYKDAVRNFEFQLSFYYEKDASDLNLISKTNGIIRVLEVKLIALQGRKLLIKALSL